jgi:uracil-DNA glycosylase family 4
MGFDNILEIEGIIPAEPVHSRRGPAKEKTTRPKATKSADERGCEVCPLNKVEGINKILGSIQGKSILVVGQSPGMDENDEEREFVGKSGKFLWAELSRVGIQRSDVDIQNVVRCLPADLIDSSYDSYLKMRDPTPREIKCCSLHTDNFIPQIKAKQVLIFGQVAAKAFLHLRAKPTEKIFWSEQLQARIYILDHPSFFIRGASAQRLQEFRDVLDVVARDRDGGKALSDPFEYIKRQDYRLVTTIEEAEEAAKIIRKYGVNRRVAVDIEDAPMMRCTGCMRQYVGHEYLELTECPECKCELLKLRKITACGFCPKPGLSFVFVFWHRDLDGIANAWCIAAAKNLLEDEAIKKALQYGCSDTLKLKQYLDIDVKGFDHDTHLSEYLRFPDAKSYGLDKIAMRRFPDFGSYWAIVAADMIAGLGDLVPEAVKRNTLSKQYDWLEKNRCIDMSKLSLEALRLYNGADCHLTKLIEVSNKKHVNEALLRVYIDLSYILYAMESNGPIFDYEQSKKLGVVYPEREKRLRAELKELAGDEDFNPGSPPQVAKLLYEKLELDYPGKGKPNTRKNTLLTMGHSHPVPKKIIEWRGTAKALSTYIEGYKTCADLNNGRLRTTWWSSGTRTGRLSSSGGGKGRKDGINLQNIHGDAQIQNTCISDIRWKKLYKAIATITAPYLAIQSFWKTLAQWEKEAEEAAKAKREFTKPKPKPNDECKAEFRSASIEMENWVRETVPDLKTFLVLDYGQVEIRVLAQLADDKELLADCQKSDIHVAVGVTMTGWDPEKIANDKATRTVTKNVHFGIAYGSGVDGVHAFVVARTPEGQTPFTREQVADAMKRYFARYKKIRVFIDNQREFAKEHSYVETIFGMRQPLIITGEHEDADDDEGDEEETTGKRSSWWGNQAINGPVQGSAHQLLECGLVNLRRKPKKYTVLNTPVMDVHDALYFRVNVLDLPKSYVTARYLMEKESLATVKSDFPEINWKVPIVTEAEAGLSLGCKIELQPGFSIGQFLIDWYHKRRKQLIALNQELAKVAQATL